MPTGTQGTQAWDRYAFVNNNPVRYNDPTGHGVDCGMGEGCMGNQTNPNDPPTSGEAEDGGGDGSGEEDQKSCLDDLVDCYMQGWKNAESALTAINNPNTSSTTEIIAIVYLLLWSSAHAGFIVGMAGLACAALSAACVAAVEGALGIGGAASADGDPTNEYNALVQMANELYPKLATKTMQMHHYWPKYLGGDPNGDKVRLYPAYHQLITNAFRSAWPYGQGAPSLFEAQRIIFQVYSKYPLPPSP